MFTIASARPASSVAHLRRAPAPARLPSKAAPRGPVRSLSTRPYIMASVQSSQKIVVDSNPSQAKLEEMGVKRWPTWGCEASKFPWSYDSTETCYVLEGEVVVTPDGGEPVTIKAGDVATFPRGMSCTWDVKKAIRKHYNFS